MPPPDDGNEYLPFIDMIALEKINNNTFRSKALAFSPGGSGRAYGGHVFCQAIWAAAHTVDSGFVIHNVTGYFILAGLANTPFVYNVKIIRDGRSYCTRIVNVTQVEGKGICFTCTCSFKKEEDSPLDVQEHIDLETTYAAALQGGKPEDMDEAPGMDLPWYNQRMKETGHNDACPGLDTRRADMTPYNVSRSAFDRRQLYYYRIIGSLPPDDANLHACAHLYASDRNSLFIVANHMDVTDRYTEGFRPTMGSLSHTVVFHVPGKDLMMTEEGSGERRWFCKEDWTTRAAGGRGIHQSRLVGPGGLHVGSSWQEGMVRVGRRRVKPEEEAKGRERTTKL